MGASVVVLVADGCAPDELNLCREQF